MALHLVKLCVGCESIKDLDSWIRERARLAKKQGRTYRFAHVTRMSPKRIDELLGGGSLYWVIRGQIACRQKLDAIEPYRDKEGIGRCRLVLEPKVIAVAPRPMRAFQGWRYLSAADAPPDLSSKGSGLADMPEPMRRELRDLGLL
jgi:hypothetical protein